MTAIITRTETELKVVTVVASVDPQGHNQRRRWEVHDVTFMPAALFHVIWTMGACMFDLPQ